MDDEARTPEAESEALIRSILSEAETEAKSIVEDAQTDAANRRAALKRRLESIETDTTERVAQRTQQISDRADAAIELIKRRSRLRLETRVYRDAERRAAATLEDLRGTKAYGSLLRGWMTEAGVGLGEPRATVRSPAADRSAVEQELATVQTALRDEHGLQTELSAGDDLPSGQGVVLTSADGSVAFDNTVRARLRRFAPEIRRIVYRTVVGSEDRDE